MEIVDLLYGATMQESEFQPGVRLEEAENR